MSTFEMKPFNVSTGYEGGNTNSVPTEMIPDINNVVNINEGGAKSEELLKEVRNAERWKTYFAVILGANVLLIILCIFLAVAGGSGSDGKRIPGLEPPLPAMTYGTEKPRLILG